MVGSEILPSVEEGMETLAIFRMWSLNQAPRGFKEFGE